MSITAGELELERHQHQTELNALKAQIELFRTGYNASQGRIAELEAGTEALKAQVELIKKAWPLTNSEHHYLFHELLSVVHQTPQQCLAEVRADAVEKVAMEFSEDKYKEYSHVREWLIDSANDIRTTTKE